MKGITRLTLVTVVIVVVVLGAVAAFLISRGGPSATATTTPTRGAAEVVGTTTSSPATSSPLPTSAVPASATPTHRKIRVAVLFDVGGRGDLSFNDMAWMGAMKAAKDFGIEVDFMTPKSLADMPKILAQLARSRKYDLIILVGFLWTKALNETADKFPYQKFALIDATTGVVRPNEVDILFREQECAALIGIIAADIAYNLMKELNISGPIKIGAVAGMSIPPLWRFHIGYLFGAKFYEKMTGRKVELLWTYTGTFNKPTVGYQTAMDLLQKGALVLYGLAGLTHIGMFDAVIDWNKQGRKAFAIGQDASQEWYAPQYIPFSGAKRVDVAVYKAIEMVVKGTWKGGIYVLGIKEGGVGIWDLDHVKWFAEQAVKVCKEKEQKGEPVPAWCKHVMSPDKVVEIVKKLREKYVSSEAWHLVEKLKKMIISGQIEFKNPKTAEEYEKIIKELEKGNLDAALAKGHIE